MLLSVYQNKKLLIIYLFILFKLMFMLIFIRRLLCL